MIQPTRRSALKLLAAGGGAAVVGLPAFAQSDFPSKVIRIVVPYPAGGTTDQLARTIAEPMREALEQAVIVDNKPGAGGLIGADYVARQPADGYTLLFGNSGPNATAPLMRQLPYDVHKDFRPLSGVVQVPLILAVPAASPHQSVADFVAWARAQGTKANYGSTGIGGSSHLATEYFNELAGTKLQHVPYKGGAPMVTALAANEVQVAFVTGLDGAAMREAGRIRYLGVASPRRTDVVPGLPAVADVVPGFQAGVWFGLLAPSGVPDAIAGKLAAIIAASVQQPEIRKVFVDRNVEPWGSTPQELGRRIDEEQAQWGPIIKKGNITI